MALLPISTVSPSSHASSPSSLPPPTPLSPTSTNDNDSSAPAPTTNGTSEKRKTSRRANTAERRATHNAVERQRRETLNGRFLDLASLLPNLTSVRRPSKSAIVNSSIALIHAQRRQRAIAARELRTLWAQFQAVKNECDEWRARAGIPPIEETPRSEDFRSLICLEIREGEEEVGEEERRAMEDANDAMGLGGGIGEYGDDGEAEDIPPPPQAIVMGQQQQQQHAAHLAAVHAQAKASLQAQQAQQQALYAQQMMVQAQQQAQVQQAQVQAAQAHHLMGRTRASTFSTTPSHSHPAPISQFGGYEDEMYAHTLSLGGGLEAYTTYHPQQTHSHSHYPATHYSTTSMTVPVPVPVPTIKSEWNIPAPSLSGSVDSQSSSSGTSEPNTPARSRSGSLAMPWGVPSIPKSASPVSIMGGGGGSVSGGQVMSSMFF